MEPHLGLLDGVIAVVTAKPHHCNLLNCLKKLLVVVEASAQGWQLSLPACKYSNYHVLNPFFNPQIRNEQCATNLRLRSSICFFVSLC